MSFVYARIKIIEYTGLSLFTLCASSFAWSLLGLLFLTAACLACASNFLSVALLSIVSHITLIMPSSSISGILSNAGSLPGTTKNLHLTYLLLCLIFTELFYV